MKYLFTYWMFLMMLPLCITSIHLEPLMRETAVQKKIAKQVPKQELTMNPIFIFK